MVTSLRQERNIPYCNGFHLKPEFGQHIQCTIVRLLRHSQYLADILRKAAIRAVKNQSLH